MLIMILNVSNSITCGPNLKGPSGFELHLRTALKEWHSTFGFPAMWQMQKELGAQSNMQPAGKKRKL